jgi:chemotaxis response regulator CheB
VAESVVGQRSPDGESGLDWTDPLAPEFIVGLGASAGGLEALERFFQAVPVDTGMALCGDSAPVARL